MRFFNFIRSRLALRCPASTSDAWMIRPMPRPPGDSVAWLPGGRYRETCEARSSGGSWPSPVRRGPRSISDCSRDAKDTKRPTPALRPAVTSTAALKVQRPDPRSSRAGNTARYAERCYSSWFRDFTATAICVLPPTAIAAPHPCSLMTAGCNTFRDSSYRNSRCDDTKGNAPHGPMLK